MITVPYEVKKALRDGMLRKNYRFVVLNDDGTEDFTIDNDTLVSESVSIDERMCSGDTLKFGLCEGSSLDFQYFMLDKGQYEANKTYMRNNLVHSNGVTWRSRTDNNTGNSLVEGDYWAEWVKPNITGRRVQVFVDVHCFADDDTSYYTIGELVANGESFTVTETCNYQFIIPANVSGVIFRYDANGIKKAEQSRPARQEPWLIVLSANVGDYFLMTSTYSFTSPVGIEASHYHYVIPMGFFDIKKCSRQASTGIIKATGYNKLQSDYLDAKANELIDEIYSDSSLPVLMADIVRNLLNDFAINPISYQKVEVPLYHGTTFFSPINMSVKTTVQYGIDTPLSYCELGNNTAYLWSYSEAPYINIDPNKAYMITFLKDYEAYERATYDVLYNTFADAQLNKTADEIMASFMLYNSAGSYDYNGFQDIIGVKLTKQDGTIEFYSTIGYENGCYKVIGTWSDLSRKILMGYRRIDFQLPRRIETHRSGTSPSGSGEAFIHLYGDANQQYFYYADSSLQDVRPGWYPIPPKYSDGTIITLQDIEDGLQFELYEITNLSDAEKIEVVPNELPDATLRDIQSSIFETVCQFGQLSRTTDLFSGVELNHSRLYPADTLFPATDLYPDGAAVSGFKSMYSKLWADEGNVHKWRYLIITYKGLDEEQNEKDYTLQRTVNADGTDDYNMSDNWLFRNLVWTAADVGDYADAMVAKMQNVTWFPFEMWCAGLPYLETGDEIEIPLNGESYTSYVLQRQLKGIQNLQDTYINGTLDIF